MGTTQHQAITWNNNCILVIKLLFLGTIYINGTAHGCSVYTLPSQLKQKVYYGLFLKLNQQMVVQCGIFQYCGHMGRSQVVPLTANKTTTCNAIEDIIILNRIRTACKCKIHPNQQVQLNNGSILPQIARMQISIYCRIWW